jgi:hypothetical protein
MGKIVPINERAHSLNQGSSWWPDMVQEAQAAHPDAPLDLAIIAESKPKDLNSALGRLMFTGPSYYHTNEYRKVIASPLMTMNRSRVTPSLHFITEGRGQSEQLIKAVHNRRLKLSKTSRVLAAALSCIALAGFSAIETDNFMKQTTPTYPHISRGESLKESQVGNEVFAGFGGLFGGAIGAIGGFGLGLGRYATITAHRKAKKQVNKLEAN